MRTWLANAAVVLLGGPTNARGVGRGAATPPRPGRDIVGEIRRAKQRGAAAVVLTGGEPTLRADLGKLARAASRLGLEVGLVTNGRMLSYAPVTEQVLQWARYLRVTWHGPAHHDRLVDVEGAGEQTYAGLTAALTRGAPSHWVDVACQVTDEVAPDLDAWLDALVSLPRTAHLGVRLVAPPRWPRDLDRFFDAAHRALAAVDGDVTASWEGFPPCRMAPYAPLREEALRSGPLALGPGDSTELLLETDRDRHAPWPCRECTDELSCPGAPVTFPTPALRPTRRPRANSFNYLLVGPLDGSVAPPLPACAARDVAAQRPRARHLLLEAQGGVSHYATSTGDFDEPAIAETKALGQLVIDQTPRGVITEYKEGVRRVVPHPACAACPDRDRCPRAFVVDPALPYAPQEAWLREVIGALSGRVLDVGCGELLYRNLLDPMIAAGRIDYHGLDPDAALIDQLARECPGAFYATTIEAFEGEASRFDHILALRSVNHLVDPHRALGVMSALLRPGGELIACDSVATGLLRSTAQLAGAESRGVGQEHLRNWSSHELLALAAAFPLVVRDHRPVTPETSDLWLLRLSRL